MRRYEYEAEHAAPGEDCEILSTRDRAGWDLVCAYPNPCRPMHTVMYFRRSTNHVASLVDALTRESAPAAVVQEAVH